MDRRELIDELIKDTIQVRSDVKNLIDLGDEMINLKPTADQWSVIECIEHLNIADAHYLHHFEVELGKAELSKKDIFKPGFLGNYFVNAMKPRPDGKIPSPMKTLRKFRPDVTKQYDTIDRFLKDQDKLLDLLEKSSSFNLNKIKITSALGRIITFKLGDAFRFVIAHNQRHVKQMKNTIQSLELVV
ncbi:MAG: DinB family protein [Reichenbachiella sp.]